MKMLIIAISLLCLFGCTPTRAKMTPVQLAALRAQVDNPVICENDTECKEMWRRAVYWVSSNSHWKIQTQTADLILTYGPGDEHYGYLAFQVNKFPLGSGSNKITMKAWCSSEDYACKQDPRIALAEFNAYLNSSRSNSRPSAAPSKPRLGITLAAVTPSVATELKMPGPKGVLVVKVSAGSIAEKATIQKGDVILQYGDNPIADYKALQEAVAATAPGSVIPIKIWRGGEIIILVHF